MSLTAWVGGFCDSLLQDTIPSGVETACSLRETVRDLWPFGRPTDAPDKFRVLIARLDSDDAQGTQTRYVTRVFLGQRGVDPVETCRVLRVTVGAEGFAVERGRDWLKRRRADLLIWGRTWKKDEWIDVWFISDAAQLDFPLHPFHLETNLLQKDFSEAAAAQLLAIALAAIKPATKDSGPYLAEALRPIAMRLRHLTAQPPPGFSNSQLGALNHALGDALSTIGDQSGVNEVLAESILAYRTALQLRPHEQAPLDWAKTQNNLGNTLRILGERESGTAHLDEAVGALRDALKEFRERAPLQWATTQNNLGNVLLTLGDREKGTARLEEAVAAYRDVLDVLKEHTRERVPRLWATTQNNLGVALGKLGERDGTARLDEAVGAFRDALNGFTRNRAPLQWATTQFNLANALLTLGERQIGTATLEEAVAAFRDALEERTRGRVPLQWAESTGNQGIALRLIAERRGDLRIAEQALAQITAAFETCRDAQHAPNAAYYEAQLPAARALVERLRKG